MSAPDALAPDIRCQRRSRHLGFDRSVASQAHSLVEAVWPLERASRSSPLPAHFRSHHVAVA